MNSQDEPNFMKNKTANKINDIEYQSEPVSNSNKSISFINKKKR